MIANDLSWRDVPRQYGLHKTIHDRFIRGSRFGVCNKIFAQPAAIYAMLCRCAVRPFRRGFNLSRPCRA